MGPALLTFDYSNRRVINSGRICVYTSKNYLEKTANLSVLYSHTILSYYPNQKITQTLQGTKRSRLVAEYNNPSCHKCVI